MHILYVRWLKSIIYPSQNTSHCEIHRKLNTAEIFTLSKNETPPDEIIHIVFFVVKKRTILIWKGKQDGEQNWSKPRSKAHRGIVCDAIL